MEKGHRRLILFPPLKIRINNVENKCDGGEGKAKIVLSAFLQERIKGYVAKIADGQLLHGERCG
jgi:hypothetical protein